jgi:transcriptional regulator with XRE-family HTH domain
MVDGSPWSERFADMANPPRNRITEIRDAKGLTLEQLAEKSGFSVGYISRMASSHRNVSLKNLQKLADALGVDARDLISKPEARGVPILSWVSAGIMLCEDAIDEAIGTISVGDLDPAGDWIALRVTGDSMNRISPPDSVILVDRNDKRLVPNACYVIDDGTGAATYKRYRSSPPRFEPVSTNAVHEAIFPENQPTVIGRVKKTILDM